MLKNSIQAVAYEKYKLAWMMKQGISLKDLIEALAEQQREDSSIGENKNLLAAYKDWDLDVDLEADLSGYVLTNSWIMSIRIHSLCAPF